MRIISNKECYVQAADIDYLIHNDKTFPLETAMRLTTKRALGNSDEKYIKLTNLEDIEYFMNADIPEFNELDKLTNEQLKLEIKLLIIKLANEYDVQNECNVKSAKERIAEYKKIKKIEYLFAQINQMLDYKLNRGLAKFPDIPHPNKEEISDGLIAGKISIKKDSIVFYAKDGRPVGDRMIPSFYKEVCSKLQKELIFEFDEEIAFTKENKQDTGYLVAKGKVKETNKKNILQLLKRK